MSKSVLSIKNEVKDRQIELAWRKREETFSPKVSKEYAWDNFERLKRNSQKPIKH